jgi:hypothetical protein
MGILGPLAGQWWSRVRARSAVRAGLAIAALGWAAIVSAQTAAPREVKLEIAASLDWASTGIAVGPGDTIVIEAGPAQVAGGAVVSPDGVSGPGAIVENVSVEGRPAPDLPYAALIGRIGGGPAFFVGSHYRVEARDTGPLELRWNFPEASWLGEAPFFPIVLRHGPVIVITGDDLGNRSATDGIATGASVIPENRPVETVAAPPRRRVAKAEPTPVVEAPKMMAWLLPGLALLLLLLLLIPAGTGVAVQRAGRARTVARTRALLALSPALDLAEGEAGAADDLPADGPAASLRARLDPGTARMTEGGVDG